MPETIKEVSDKLDQVSGIVNSTAGDVKVLTARTSSLEVFHNEAKDPVGWVRFIRGGLILFAVIAVAQGLYFFKEINFAVRDVTHHEKAIDSIVKRVGDLEKARNQVLHHMAAGNFNPYYQEFIGKIERINKDEITLLEIYTIGKSERTFKVSPGARIKIDGNGAQITDLKVGMFALVL